MRVKETMSENVAQVNLGEQNFSAMLLGWASKRTVLRFCVEKKQVLNAMRVNFSLRKSAEVWMGSCEFTSFENEKESVPEVKKRNNSYP